MDYDPKTATVHGAVTVGSVLVYGLTLEQWVGLLTIVVLALQAGLLLAKYWRGLRQLIKRWRQ